ncbi:MAG: NUDIX hydrolase [Clostridia bacterium]|nr:NUDIX hydrolase [Clostridia bacterium]
MEKETNWSQSVAGVIIRDGKVLLARHTYGSGNGKLIIPGGYVGVGETPEDALKREFMEETGVEVEPLEIIGIRFNMHDWYVVFLGKWVCGEARSDGDENSEVVWMDIDEALSRDDVPQLTKEMLESAAARGGMTKRPYEGKASTAPHSLWRV